MRRGSVAGPTGEVEPISVDLVIMALGDTPNPIIRDSERTSGRRARDAVAVGGGPAGCAQQGSQHLQGVLCSGGDAGARRSRRRSARPAIGSSAQIVGG